MASKLYYGNGECEIRASEDILGVEIHYEGSIIITDKNSDSILKLHRNNKIIIVSLNGNHLNHLFYYMGGIKIKSIIVADNNAKRVPTSVHRVADIAELLNSNPEDMTETKAEDIKIGLSHGKAIGKESSQILKNQHTSNYSGNLYLENGLEFTGNFHIHTLDGGAMTGKKHTKDSQLLYTKLVLDKEISDILIPTNDVRNAVKKHKGFGKRIRVKKIEKKVKFYET